jgi:ATP-dependent helicase/nuclease subunit B
MRDPYIIFAKYILGLYPLNDIKQELTYADYGTIVHEVLKKFNDEYNAEYPSDAYHKLVKLGQEEFDKNNISPEQKSFWWPNFLKIADWIVNKEQEYRKTISRVYNEIKGQYEFDAPAGKFVLTAKADRIDITKTGKVNIIDYKTGQARKTKEIQHSYAPQLPIEAIIAEHGGFPDITAKEAEALIYWKLGKEETGIFENTQEVVDNAEERIKKLISLFDFETTAYVTCPNPKYAPKYSDYEHLSRIREITFGEEN